MIRSLMLVPLAGLAMAGPALSAQSRASQGQSGFSASFGFGTGRLTQDCSRCTRTSTNSSSAWSGRLSYASTPHTTFGVEFDRWRKTFTYVSLLSGDTAQSVNTGSWISVAAQWYPSTYGWSRGAYVKGLVGMAVYEPGTIKTHAIGAGAGVGFDIPVVNGVALTPYFDVLVSRDGEHKFPVRDRAGRVAQTPVKFNTFMKALGVALRIQRLP